MLCGKAQFSPARPPSPVHTDHLFTGSNLNGMRYRNRKTEQPCVGQRCVVLNSPPLSPDSHSRGMAVIPFDEKASGHSGTWARAKVVCHTRFQPRFILRKWGVMLPPNPHQFQPQTTQIPVWHAPEDLRQPLCVLQLFNQYGAERLLGVNITLGCVYGQKN